MKPDLNPTVSTNKIITRSSGQVIAGQTQSTQQLIKPELMPQLAPEIKTIRGEMNGIRASVGKIAIAAQSGPLLYLTPQATSSLKGLLEGHKSNIELINRNKIFSIGSNANASVYPDVIRISRGALLKALLQEIGKLYTVESLVLKGSTSQHLLFPDIMSDTRPLTELDKDFHIKLKKENEVIINEANIAQAINRALASLLPEYPNSELKHLYGSPRLFQTSINDSVCKVLQFGDGDTDITLSYDEPVAITHDKAGMIELLPWIETDSVASCRPHYLLPKEKVRAAIEFKADQYLKTDWSCLWVMGKYINQGWFSSDSLQRSAIYQQAVEQIGLGFQGEDAIRVKLEKGDSYYLINLLLDTAMRVNPPDLQQRYTLDTIHNISPERKLLTIIVICLRNRLYRMPNEVDNRLAAYFSTLDTSNIQQQLADLRLVLVLEAALKPSSGELKILVSEEHELLHASLRTKNGGKLYAQIQLPSGSLNNISHNQDSVKEKQSLLADLAKQGIAQGIADRLGELHQLAQIIRFNHSKRFFADIKSEVGGVSEVFRNSILNTIMSQNNKSEGNYSNVTKQESSSKQKSKPSKRKKSHNKKTSKKQGLNKAVKNQPSLVADTYSKVVLGNRDAVEGCLLIAGDSVRVKGCATDITLTDWITQIQTGNDLQSKTPHEVTWKGSKLLLNVTDIDTGIAAASQLSGIATIVMAHDGAGKSFQCQTPFALCEVEGLTLDLQSLTNHLDLGNIQYYGPVQVRENIHGKLIDIIPGIDNDLNDVAMDRSGRLILQDKQIEIVGRFDGDLIKATEITALSQGQRDVVWEKRDDFSHISFSFNSIIQSLEKASFWGEVMIPLPSVTNQIRSIPEYASANLELSSIMSPQLLAKCTDIEQGCYQIEPNEQEFKERYRGEFQLVANKKGDQFKLLPSEGIVRSKLHSQPVKISRYEVEQNGTYSVHLSRLCNNGEICCVALASHDLKSYQWDMTIKMTDPQSGCEPIVLYMSDTKQVDSVEQLISNLLYQKTFSNFSHCTIPKGGDVAQLRVTQPQLISIYIDEGNLVFANGEIIENSEMTDADANVRERVRRIGNIHNYITKGIVEGVRTQFLVGMKNSVPFICEFSIIGALDLNHSESSVLKYFHIGITELNKFQRLSGNRIHNPSSTHETFLTYSFKETIPLDQPFNQCIENVNLDTSATHECPNYKLAWSKGYLHINCTQTITATALSTTNRYTFSIPADTINSLISAENNGKIIPIETRCVVATEVRGQPQLNRMMFKLMPPLNVMLEKLANGTFQVRLIHNISEQESIEFASNSKRSDAILYIKKNNDKNIEAGVLNNNRALVEQYDQVVGLSTVLHGYYKIFEPLIEAIVSSNTE